MLETRWDLFDPGLHQSRRKRQKRPHSVLVNDMLKSKKVGFLHIYTTYRKTGNKFPLFVVPEEFELFQHVVDHYKKDLTVSKTGEVWFR
jgi:hypothetical protein